MKKGFFLITGASKGIGEALARNLVEKGHTVLGVSRSRSEALTSRLYQHLVCDLSKTAELNRITETAASIVEEQSFDMLCLVNNASQVEPLASIDRCPPDEIEAHLIIGLIAPAILTSQFIARFASRTARKKVAFMSSGAGIRANPDMSIYSSAKAAINMFARCVGLEQQHRDNGFEVVAIGPGMVETQMQQTARAKSADEFAVTGMFREAAEAGFVRPPGEIAAKIVTILENRYEQGAYVNANDV